MSLNIDPSVEFFKMQGSGNDFVVIDNRTARVAEADMADWAKKLCRRAFGVGADGLFFLEGPGDREDVDFVWHFYNSDGSRAEMCGNGSRCAARLAYELGLAPEGCAIGTDAGVVHAQVYPDTGRVSVKLTPPRDMKLDADLGIAGLDLPVHFVNTGVPHAVVVSDDVTAMDVDRLGREIRFHQEFAPAGANVNFAQVADDRTMYLRTYERGVEAETFACGTGACAAAAVVHELGLTGEEVEVTTSGGERLVITLSGGDVYLTGGAEMTFVGRANLESVGLV
ncbi:diaminopimelate epimerase [Desulfohalovibrio reitneri]|uniref:diaminopimelate epimerase n=1 Tax=Desulfohalovibrio reitneri TaxID=1307759 RepID=UPI0004A731C5|nr:diaminopimelate epimerase [Desulfohalovibrio reitneri]